MLTKGLGNGDNGEFTFLDSITVVSFIIGVLNLQENMTQSDKADLQQDLADKADMLLSEIHKHLQMQDDKLDRILEKLEA